MIVPIRKGVVGLVLRERDGLPLLKKGGGNTLRQGNINRASAKKESMATHIILLALVVISKNLKNLRRSLKRDNGLGRGIVRNQPINQCGHEAHLHGKVCLIRQLTGETVR